MSEMAHEEIAEVVSGGFRLLDDMAGDEVCDDRSCLRCRFADVLLDLMIRFNLDEPGLKARAVP